LLYLKSVRRTLALFPKFSPIVICNNDTLANDDTPEREWRDWPL